MPQKNKKQKHESKRKALRKKQRAQQSSKPKLFRTEPSLQEALDHRHPLVACLISNGWEESKFASIFVIRDAPTGLVMSSFAVDVAGVGLKDAWGNYALSSHDIEEMKSNAAENGVHLVSCELSLAEKLIYSGILWSRKFNFRLPKEYKIWLRILNPQKKDAIDLEPFGVNGKPFMILDEDDSDEPYKAVFNPKILGGKIIVEKDGISVHTLHRIADIKAALIGFSHSPEFKQDFDAAVQDQFGSLEPPEAEYEWIAFQDRFVLEHVLESGETVIGRFVEDHKETISEDVRQLVLGWQFAVEGFFEVKEMKAPDILMWNLINEKEYRVFPTADMDNMNVKVGDFLFARIVPVKSCWVFSGSAAIFPSDGSEAHRMEMYRNAVQIQMKSPKLAFRDNEKKLQKSCEAVRTQYNDFVSYFGADVVADTGKRIQQKYNDLFQYLYFERKDPASGLTPAEKYEQDNGRPYRRLEIKLPREVRKSKDVGMLFDPDEGVSFLIDYRRFMDIFEHPETYLYDADAKETVLGYLMSDSISDMPFRRVAQKYPENFRKVISYLGGQEGFSCVDIEELMRKFKPDSYNKLPTTVSILDPELSKAARFSR